MAYTKGIRGPESTNRVTIEYLRQDGIDANPMAKGLMNVHLKKESRMVSLLAQGKHARALLDAHAKHGDELTVKMRWTGREAATITGVVVNEEIKKAA